MGSPARLGAALAVAVTALAGPLAAGARAAEVPAVAPARGQPDPGGEQAEPGAPPPGRVFVQVSPGTVEAGFLVGVRASCRDNSVPAIVVSDAFGRIAVQPQWGLLTASPMVRERTRPGNYPVKLECRDGETASTMLQVVKRMPTPTHQPTHRPSRGPATGFGGTARDATGGLLLPGGLALTVAGVTIGVFAACRPRAGSRKR
ncbi:hypothetical protein ACFY2R_08965 [Micromonospora olivasterospora]|uniref:Ig-like domain-containing protein n=1 Tax=Micromonospora olivasterospora TaxID=1880 RepID=A0A562IES0_MICOL|nr:hypothetical protein [Micromonospora olivasterospora]TWH69328.1 hypothetical protein JD77_04337 [Micromonospora olivasterospora]